MESKGVDLFLSIQLNTFVKSISNTVYFELLKIVFKNTCLNVYNVQMASYSLMTFFVFILSDYTTF